MMRDGVITAFLDELEKISTSNVALQSISTNIGKPMSPASPVTPGGKMKPITSTTNYTTVSNNQPMAATGTADGSKSMAPPAVRT
jgi:hypothetical protein